MPHEPQPKVAPKVFSKTQWGELILGDALDFLPSLADNSVNLVMTSPPFGLVRKKAYGNVDAAEYLEWFRPFAREIFRILAPSGSFVLDIGGAWNPGLPTRSLYHYELLIMLCKEFGFHLAQDFFWYNPSKLPSPAEWVTVRRVRVKDAVNCVWWLSKTPFPKASNRRVLTPYSNSMKQLLQQGYKPKLRPSGHDISEQFSIDNGAAIPPNLIAIANTESNSSYLRYCKENNIKPHPARFPAGRPEFFVRMLTDENDLVVDPFAGSCVTGEVCETLHRRFICCELVGDYLRGAVHRLDVQRSPERRTATQYSLHHPAALWDGIPKDLLPVDGGRQRATKPKPKQRISKARADITRDKAAHVDTGSRLDVPFVRLGDFLAHANTDLPGILDPRGRFDRNAIIIVRKIIPQASPVPVNREFKGPEPTNAKPVGVAGIDTQPPLPRPPGGQAWPAVQKLN